MSVISISAPVNIDSDSDMSDDDTSRAIVTPGELVTDDPSWMKGHGTYFLNEKTYSSVAGNVSRVNRLLARKVPGRDRRPCRRTNYRSG